FGLVYLFWGSTYLGIAIAVEHLPPALMCATRFLIAGIVMLAYCGFRGRQILFSFRQLWHMAVVGTLLLMAGNLTLSYPDRVLRRQPDPLVCRACRAFGPFSFGCGRDAAVVPGAGRLACWRPSHFPPGPLGTCSWHRWNGGFIVAEAVGSRFHRTSRTLVLAQPDWRFFLLAPWFPAVSSLAV